STQNDIIKVEEFCEYYEEEFEHPWFREGIFATEWAKEQVFEKGTDVVINCSGLGAKELVEEDDKKTNSFLLEDKWLSLKCTWTSQLDLSSKEMKDKKLISSLALKMKMKKNTKFSLDERNSQTEPDPQVTQEIIKGCKEVRPALFTKELEIVAKKCGLRPYKEGGIRIELKPFGDKGWICHNYGYSKQGFQSSYGSAKE
ncbi:6670_t:CDS:2, partial [Funneliformis geosporum]